jgi:hypothetical protein
LSQWAAIGNFGLNCCAGASSRFAAVKEMRKLLIPLTIYLTLSTSAFAQKPREPTPTPSPTPSFAPFDEHFKKSLKESKEVFDNYAEDLKRSEAEFDKQMNELVKFTAADFKTITGEKKKAKPATGTDLYTRFEPSLKLNGATAAEIIVPIFFRDKSARYVAYYEPHKDFSSADAYKWLVSSVKRALGPGYSSRTTASPMYSEDDDLDERTEFYRNGSENVVVTIIWSSKTSKFDAAETFVRVIVGNKL